MAAVIDEQPSHRLRAERQSMRAPLPVLSALVLHAQPGLVDERRRLQRVIAPLLGQVPAGDAAQLAVDEREELGGWSRAFGGHAHLSNAYSCRASRRGCRSGSAPSQPARKSSYALRAVTRLPDIVAARASPRRASG